MLVLQVLLLMLRRPMLVLQVLLLCRLFLFMCFVGWRTLLRLDGHRHREPATHPRVFPAALDYVFVRCDPRLVSGGVNSNLHDRRMILFRHADTRTRTSRTQPTAQQNGRHPSGCRP